MTKNYELFMQGQTGNFFSLKLLQHQKRYPCWVLFNPQVMKVHLPYVQYFNYPEHLTQFGTSQLIPDNEIIKLVDFTLPCNWHKKILVQGFNSTSNSLNELVEFCEHLEAPGEIFQDKGDGTQTKKTKQFGGIHQSVSSAKFKVGSNQTAKTLEYDTSKMKTSPPYPLHDTGNNMNSCKVMQSQENIRRRIVHMLVQEEALSSLTFLRISVLMSKI